MGLISIKTPQTHCLRGFDFIIQVENHWQLFEFYYGIFQFTRSNTRSTPNQAIKDVYAEKDGYDEDQVRAKLIEMKKKIAESEDLLFEKKVLPIERELSRMQHLVFGSMQIRKLYIECRALTASKYNAYMTLVR